MALAADDLARTRSLIVNFHLYDVGHRRGSESEQGRKERSSKPTGFAEEEIIKGWFKSPGAQKAHSSIFLVKALAASSAYLRFRRC